MVFNSVSETETTPITPPPPPPPSPQLQPQPQSQPQPPQLQPQPQPQPAMNSSFVFSATNSQSQPINSSYSAYSNFRWSLNHPHSNPNRLGSIPANNTNSGFWGLRLGPNGFTLGDSGLNPIPRFISSGSSLNSGLRLGSNQTENNIISPGLGFSNRDMVMTEKSGVEEPVEQVEVSDKKGKSKLYGSVRVPERNKGSGSGSGYATDEGENGDVDGCEAEISSDDEDLPNSLKNWNLKEDEEGKKIWNLRPRKAVPKSAPPTGGGSRNGGRKGQPSRDKPQQATPTRPRGAAAAAPPRRPMFSISLTKEEIEEDFIKMTGKKPPKKNKRSSKNVQKQMDACFPALWLRDVTPEMYKVPDPPLKG